MNHPEQVLDKSTRVPLRVYIDLAMLGSADATRGEPAGPGTHVAEGSDRVVDAHAVYRLASDFDMEANEIRWQQFSAIEIDFPTFQDGRGYSHAKRLREVYGYEKEIRAVGDVRPDQIHYLLRSGFDAIIVSRADQLALFEAALNRFSSYYRGVETERWPNRVVSKFI